jgi:hypothetical protein
MRLPLLLASILCLSLAACGDDTIYSVADGSAPDAAIKDGNIADNNLFADIQVIGDGSQIPPPGSFDLLTPFSGAIQYQNGPVLTQPTHIYAIWYGAWQNSTTPPILEDLLSSVGNSSYFTTDTVYYQLGNPIALNKFPDAGNMDAGVTTMRGFLRSINRPAPRNLLLEAGMPEAGDEAGSDVGTDAEKHYVSSDITLITNYMVGYPNGATLYDSDMVPLIANTLYNNKVSIDPNGIYFIFTSSDVNVYYGLFQLCSDFCAYHSDGFINLTHITYALVGDTANCLDICSATGKYMSYGYEHSPNENWSADAMASAMVHELVETMSDPYSDGWFDLYGNENADKCAYVYLNLYGTKNGSVANTRIGDRDWLIQSNWSLFMDGGQGCALHQQ